MDLNLLFALDALLHQENVSRAAVQLGLTQSGMSRALRRLRDHFNDPLFVRTGRGMRPTPFAKRLRPMLRRTLHEVHQVICARPGFNPSQARGTFRLIIWGYAETLFLPPLLQTIREVTPGIHLDVRPPHDNLEDSLEDDHVDLILGAPQQEHCDHRWMHLLEEPYALLARGDHPMLAASITPGRLAALAHVVVMEHSHNDSIIDHKLHQRGLQRQIQVRVSSVLSVRTMLLKTDMVTLLPSRIAHHLAEHTELRVFTLPSSLQDSRFTLSMGFHVNQQHDPTHRWLREQIQNIAEELTHPR